MPANASNTRYLMWAHIQLCQDIAVHTEQAVGRDQCLAVVQDRETIYVFKSDPADQPQSVDANQWDAYGTLIGYVHVDDFDTGIHEFTQPLT